MTEINCWKTALSELRNGLVAGEATKIQVVVSNGSQYPAKLIGGGPKTDLMVIWIEANQPLPHLNFRDSDKVGVGKWVFAIGTRQGPKTGTPRGASARSTHKENRMKKRIKEIVLALIVAIIGAVIFNNAYDYQYPPKIKQEYMPVPTINIGGHMTYTEIAR